MHCWKISFGLPNKYVINQCNMFVLWILKVAYKVFKVSTKYFISIQCVLLHMFSTFKINFIYVKTNHTFNFILY